MASIGAAVGMAALVGLSSSPVAWPLGGLFATAIYLSGVNVEMTLRERERRADEEQPG